METALPVTLSTSACPSIDTRAALTSFPLGSFTSKTIVGIAVLTSFKRWTQSSRTGPGQASDTQTRSF